MENEIITIANDTNHSLTKLAASLTMEGLELKRIKTIEEVETLSDYLHPNLDTLKEEIVTSSGLVTDLIEQYNLLEETIKLQKDQLNKQQNDLEGLLTKYTEHSLPLVNINLKGLYGNVTALESYIGIHIKSNEEQKENVKDLYHKKYNELHALNHEIDELNKEQENIISNLEREFELKLIFDEDGNIRDLTPTDEEE